MTTPSIGRIVHYVSRGSKDDKYPSTCRAAIVTDVRESSIPDTDPSHRYDEDRFDVDLCVINPTGMFFDQHVAHARPAEFFLGGTWHWPEKV